MVLTVGKPSIQALQLLDNVRIQAGCCVTPPGARLEPDTASSSSSARVLVFLNLDSSSLPEEISYCEWRNEEASTKAESPWEVAITRSAVGGKLSHEGGCLSGRSFTQDKK